MFMDRRKRIEGALRDLATLLGVPPQKFWPNTARIRLRLYDILEHGTIGEPAGRFVGRLIVSLIILNLVAVTLESMPEYQARYQLPFTIIEALSLVVFT